MAVQHGVGDWGQEGQQGPAIERDGDGQPAEPGAHEQRNQRFH